jgi:hypothetical protein
MRFRIQLIVTVTTMMSASNTKEYYRLKYYIVAHMVLPANKIDLQDHKSHIIIET